MGVPPLTRVGNALFVCRHLKLRNPAVAAEIYIRLLDNPTVPKRERAMVLRKLAESKTMLVGS